MTDKYDPRNNRFRHVFNPNGLITDVLDPEGGSWSFSRSVDNSGTTTVTMQTGEGNITTYQDRTDSTGAYTSITTSPFGLTSTFFRSSDGLTETEQPSCGMSQTMEIRPRSGLQIQISQRIHPALPLRAHPIYYRYPHLSGHQCRYHSRPHYQNPRHQR